MEFQTKEALVYNQLKDLILFNKLPQNKFLSQRMLARITNSTIITVRTALRKLENDDLIENTPQWGVHIPAETPERIRDRYYMRELLEVGAVRRIIQQRGKIDFSVLRDKAKQCDRLSSQSGESLQTFAHLHFEFHQEISRLSGSSLLFKTYNKLSMQSLMLFNAQRGWLRGLDREPNLHQGLCECIEKTDEEEAVIQAIKTHIRHGLQIELDALSGD